HRYDARSVQRRVPRAFSRLAAIARPNVAALHSDPPTWETDEVGSVLVRAGSSFGSRSQSGGYKVIYFAGLSGKGGHQSDENFVFCRRRAFGGEIAKSPRIVERSARFQRRVDLARQDRKNFIHLAGPGYPDARDLGQAL